MKKNIIRYKNRLIVLFLLFVVSLNSCGIEYTQEQQNHITSIIKMRKEKDTQKTLQP